jgi:hypothetical protein
MIVVNGWCSENQRTPTGIESVKRTRAQERQQHERQGQVAGGLDVAGDQPATAGQITARLIIASRPATASHSTQVAVVSNPRSSATPITRASAITVWIRLPSTWPVRTDARTMAMVRKR